MARQWDAGSAQGTKFEARGPLGFAGVITRFQIVILVCAPPIEIADAPFAEWKQDADAGPTVFGRINGTTTALAEMAKGLGP